MSGPLHCFGQVVWLGGWAGIGGEFRPDALPVVREHLLARERAASKLLDWRTVLDWNRLLPIGHVAHKRRRDVEVPCESAPPTSHSVDPNLEIFHRPELLATA